jgi:small-conductance mechanosensitive channel
MDVETETTFKRLLSKIQETILTFRKQIEKVNGRVIHLEDRIKIVEHFLQENEDIDPSEMIDMRARLSTMDKSMRKDIGNMLQILQSMKETQITMNSRIEILEDTIKPKDLVGGQINEESEGDTVEEIIHETEEMLKDVGKE